MPKLTDRPDLVKQAYEDNTDTNVVTDSEKSALGDIPVLAGRVNVLEANAYDDSALVSRVNVLEADVADIFLRLSILEAYHAAPNPSNTNQGSAYEVDFIAPTYDANNSEHFLITPANNGFSQINNLAYKSFFVEPGDYGTTKIDLTADGTAGDRRYIALHNGNDTHPASLTNAERAKVGLDFLGDYWVVDRVGFWDDSSATSPVTFENGSNNVLNRHYLYDCDGGIVMYAGAHNNIVQRSHLEKDNINLHRDIAGLGMVHTGTSAQIISNNKFLSNNVINYADGFQAVRYFPGNNAGLSYEGTVVDNNVFTCDSRFRTDGNGNHSPNGAYSYAENGIDIKAGSDDAANPMILTNNKMHGYRQSDTTNSTLDSKAAGIVLHHGVKNTLVDDNVIYDCGGGIYSSGNKSPDTDYSMLDSWIRRNIMRDIQRVSLSISSGFNITIEDNLQKNIGITSNWAMAFVTGSLGGGGGTFVNNKAFQCNGKVIRGENPPAVISGNEYHDNGSMQLTPTSGSNVIHPTDPSTGYADLTFVTGKYTLNPQTITVPSVVAP